MVAAAPTAAAVADQVWEETLADHSGTAGSTAEALNAAGAAGDPWTTALPGAYGAGSAGKIIGDNINAPLDVIDTNVDQIETAVITNAAGDRYSSRYHCSESAANNGRIHYRCLNVNRFSYRRNR